MKERHRRTKIKIQSHPQTHRQEGKEKMKESHTPGRFSSFYFSYTLKCVVTGNQHLNNKKLVGDTKM